MRNPLQPAPTLFREIPRCTRNDLINLQGLVVRASGTQHKALSICILLVINIFTFLSSFGQTITVRDSSTNRTLENIAVFNPQKTKSALSNNRGVIKIDVFDDNDIIIFQHPSYKTVHYTKNQLKELNYKLHLSHHIRLLKEFVLSASKFEEKKADISFRMEIIDHKQIEMLNPQTSADVLQMTGKIMVQKSQMGGGSPVIRGFEANKILLVVDGVRMNNAIYRSGHLQNIITIDNAILERTEILFGPGSVVYGSDALGGVMHFYTKNPQLAVNDTSVNSNLNAYIRYSSANNEQTAHFDFQLGFKKIGFLTSFTRSDFGDLRMGQVRQTEYPNFGKVFYYARRINGKDTMLANDNSNIHKRTGYSQDNLVQKILYRPNEFLNFTLNVQYSTSSDIPRFDMLNDTLQGGGLKFAEWHYGPQKRLFTSLNIDLKSKSKWFDESKLVLAYQKIDEDRITRKFGEPDRFNREEDVKVYSMNLDFIKKITSPHNLQYGLEFTHNDVRSTAFSENIVDTTVDFAATRYPDGGSIMQTFAGYLNYKWHPGKKSIVNTGIRYSHTLLHSDFIDTTVYKFPYDEIDINTGALTGSASIVYRPAESWQVNLLASTGFRSPNVDDYGKVFAKDDFVTIPNDNLKPEYIYSGEAGINKSLRNDFIKINTSVFYTYLTDAVVRREFELNGADSLVYDGDTLKILANTNAGKSLIYGGYLGITVNITHDIIINSNVSYTSGKDITDDVPLAHIPPFFGKTSISYQFKKFNSMFYSYYNGWKRKKDYSPSNEDNLSEATEDGTPPWYTLNFTSSYKIHFSHKKQSSSPSSVAENTLYLQFAVENILDRHYKSFASGISAPGRNFIITLRVNI